MTDPIDHQPPLPPPPPDSTAYPPRMTRVRRTVLAEPENMLASVAGHLASYRLLGRLSVWVDRDNTNPEPSPDGIAYRDIGSSETGVILGPFVNAPDATHIELVLHYRLDETATGTPTVEITLEEADALDGTDVDAPAVEATNGITLTGNDLPGDEQSPFRLVTLPLRNVEDTPTSYPTGPRCLDYHGTADDTLMQIRIVPTNVDIVRVDADEIIST